MAGNQEQISFFLSRSTSSHVVNSLPVSNHYTLELLWPVHASMLILRRDGAKYTAYRVAERAVRVKQLICIAEQNNPVRTD